uniref:response regulator n=1 Tax=Blastomonas sp. TaxID=1909299 RepID=UPI0035947906
LLGHQVTSTVDSVAAGIAAVAAGGFDSAILDVNLGTEKVWPLAEALRDKGVPFVFASGGGDEIPAHLTDRPTLPKPYSMAGLEEALAQLG